MTKCTIKGCNGEAIKKYDLFGNRPHFLTSSLCKKHAEDADKSLARKGLRVLPDGSYTKLISNSDFIATKIKDEVGEKNITIESLRKINRLIQKHEKEVRKDTVLTLLGIFKKERNEDMIIFEELQDRFHEKSHCKISKEMNDNLPSLINQVAGTLFSLNYIVTTLESYAKGEKISMKKTVNWERMGEDFA